MYNIISLNLEPKMARELH